MYTGTRYDTYYNSSIVLLQLQYVHTVVCICAQPMSCHGIRAHSRPWAFVRHPPPSKLNDVQIRHNYTKINTCGTIYYRLMGVHGCPWAGWDGGRRNYKHKNYHLEQIYHNMYSMYICSSFFPLVGVVLMLVLNRIVLRTAVLMLAIIFAAHTRGRREDTY